VNREGGINKNQLHFWIAHGRNWVTVIIVKLMRKKKTSLGPGKKRQKIQQNTATLQCGPKAVDNTFRVMAALETESVFAWIHYTRAAHSGLAYFLLSSFQ
jgi:hypothetical protein